MDDADSCRCSSPASAFFAVEVLSLGVPVIVWRSLCVECVTLTMARSRYNFREVSFEEWAVGRVLGS